MSQTKRITLTFLFMVITVSASGQSRNLSELARQANPKNWIFTECQEYICKKERMERLVSNMVLIPAGKFEMGSNDGYSYEKPVHWVYLDAYYIDKTEVTVEDYEKCVQSGKCQKPDTGIDCNWGKSDRKNHPIICIDWYNANQYCQFVDKRLPTEAEWEKAASWKNGQKYKYPTGHSISCKLAVMRNCKWERTWPVASKPAEINGTYDMAGNAWEWVADWNGRYPSTFQNNPTGPSSGSGKTYRGGSWIYNSSHMRNTLRKTDRPSYQGIIGVRCAISAQ